MLVVLSCFKLLGGRFVMLGLEKIFWFCVLVRLFPLMIVLLQITWVDGSLLWVLLKLF